jgi:hypothetical protein
MMVDIDQTEPLARLLAEIFSLRSWVDPGRLVQMGRYYVILEEAGKKLWKEVPQKTRLALRIKSYSARLRRYWAGGGLSAPAAW